MTTLRMQLSPIRIRQAESGDAAPISYLLQLLDYTGTESFIAGKIQQQRHHADAQLLVAMEADAAGQDKVLGFISLHFIPQIAVDGDFCRISYLCVDTDLRGKGVGAALLAHAEAMAVNRGCDRMELHCHSRRERAHQFYLNNGYLESPKYLLKLLR